MIHVLPLRDLQEHERSTACPCGPRIETDAEILVIHSAYDGREMLEEEGRETGFAPWFLEQDGVVIDDDGNRIMDPCPECGQEMRMLADSLFACNCCARELRSTDGRVQS